MSLSIRRPAVTGLMSLCSVVGMLAFSVPALAATPEAPELRVEAVTATTATLQGVLSPNVPGQVGTYEFLYNQGGSCKGAGKASGVALGGQGEGVSEALPGLSVNTEYTVCLVVENTEGKTAESTPLSFKTALPPETPETLSPAVEITATTAKFEGVLNPKNAGNHGSYEFLYRPSGTECQEGAATPAPAGVAGGLKSEAVTSVATGLAPASLYTFCLLARNEAGEEALGAPVTFTTPAAPPTVESESASSVKAIEATLEAQVNPNSEKTTYVFEYSTEEALLGTAGATVLAGAEPFAAGFGGQRASVATGAVLAQHTAYFYRVVAENQQSKLEGKPVDGAVRSFETALAPEPPKTEGATEVTSTTAKLHGVLNPNHAGDTGTYEFVYRKSATECQGEGETATAPIEAHGLSPEPVPPEEAAGLTPGTAYTFCLRVTNGASESALGNPATFTTPAVGPTAGEEFVTAVSSGSATLHGWVNPGGAQTTFHFDYGTSTAYGQRTAELPVGADDTQHPVTVQIQGLQPGTTYHYRIVLTGSQGPVGGAPGPDQTFTTQSQGGALVLPDGRAWELVTPTDMGGAEVGNPWMLYGGVMQVAENGNAITYATSAPIGAERLSNPSVPQALSRRSPAGWSTQDISPAHGEAITAELTERGFALPVPESLGGDYTAFSPDLSLSYLSPRHWNTSFAPPDPVPPRGSGEGEGGWVRDESTGTYTYTKLSAEEWSVEQATLAQGPLKCEVSTSPAKGEGVDSVSRDGCYVYFNSESTALAPGATGKDPFYVAHYEGGAWTTTFISSLSTAEGTGAVPWGSPFMELSPSGRYVAFMSAVSLTGYDNHDAISGQPDEEVFLYDAVTNHLVCASCNPTGARPMGQLDTSSGDQGDGVADEVLVDPLTALAGHWLAGVLPKPWNLAQSSAASRTPRYLINSGRLFFDSPDTLVPQAVNGLENVYEYEPGGVGSCQSEKGCVSLISSGTSSKESALIEVTPSGEDVFVITTSRLVSQDESGSFKIYDAHVCSASVPCAASAPASPPVCETSDSCKAPVTPQSTSFGVPPSATFAGAGNVTQSPQPGVTPRSRAQKLAAALRACTRKPKARRRSCQSRARKRYAKPSRAAAAGSPSKTAKRNKV